MSTHNFQICEHCGTSRNSTDLFCGVCGQPVGTVVLGNNNPTKYSPARTIPPMNTTQPYYTPLSPTQSVNLTRSSSHRIYLIIIGVLVFALIGAGLFIGIQIGKGGTPAINNKTNTPVTLPTLQPSVSTPGGNTPTPTITQSTPTPTPSPTPSPTSTPAWQGCHYGPNGWADWSFPSGWTILSGMVLTDDNRDNVTLAPDSCQPHTLNYAVEMKIKLLNNPPWAFGFFVRYTPGTGGYGTWLSMRDCTANISTANDVNNLDQEVLKGTGANSCSGEHTYRTVVKNNTISFFLDGTLYVSDTDNTYVSSPGQVGLFVHLQTQIESFSVTPV